MISTFIKKKLSEISHCILEKVEDLDDEKTVEELFKKHELTKNELKLIRAIKQEARKQKTKEPLISRGVFIKKYRINNRYLDVSIKNLLSKELISREITQFKGKIKTSSWKVL